MASNVVAEALPSSAELSALVAGKESSPDELKRVAEDLQHLYAGPRIPESVRMLITIAQGRMMGGSDGWFGPAQSKFDWKTLAETHRIAFDGSISAEKFRGSPEWFARLDRNRNGAITAEDLDWSDSNHWVQHAYLVNRLLRRLDTKGDGKLTRAEWMTFFDTVSQFSDVATIEELREAWLTGISASFYPGDAPTQQQLVQGLLNGELGSLYEGPSVGDPAPDFTLTTQDGKQTVHLADVIGPKPVVLVFGNFTCSPFRSMYPGVEAVYRRFQNDATFLAIYVREAHPADGWKMESNTKLGVEVSQPTTLAERTAVASQCCRLLNPGIPLLVDEIDDRVGNAYSGMPARLYVIDQEGLVTYKAGRGPFGFKVGEMEQSLIMTLMAAQPSRS
ncbi:MAG: deiodinase family protein [Planctomycetota bacterium]